MLSHGGLILLPIPKFSSIEDVIKYIKDLNQVRDTLPFEMMVLL